LEISLSKRTFDERTHTAAYVILPRIGKNTGTEDVIVPIDWSGGQTRLSIPPEEDMSETAVGLTNGYYEDLLFFTPHIYANFTFYPVESSLLSGFGIGETSEFRSMANSVQLSSAEKILRFNSGERENSMDRLVYPPDAKHGLAGQSCANAYDGCTVSVKIGDTTYSAVLSVNISGGLYDASVFSDPPSNIVIGGHVFSISEKICPKIRCHDFFQTMTAAEKTRYGGIPLVIGIFSLPASYLLYPTGDLYIAQSREYAFAEHTGSYYLAASFFIGNVIVSLYFLSYGRKPRGVATVMGVLELLAVVLSTTVNIYYIATDTLFEEIYYSSNFYPITCRVFSTFLAIVACMTLVHVGLSFTPFGSKSGRSESIPISIWCAIISLLLSTKKETLVTAWIGSIGVWNAIARTHYIIKTPSKITLKTKTGIEESPTWVSKVISFVTITTICPLSMAMCVEEVPGIADQVILVSYLLCIFLCFFYIFVAHAFFWK